MPKNRVKVEAVDKTVFMRVLALKNCSIRKLGSQDLYKGVKCSEKTIRRELNDKDNPGLRPKWIHQIAQAIDVDPRLLTGKLMRDNPQWKSNHYDPLEHISDYPYSRIQLEHLRKEKISSILKRVLSLFEIGYSQFENMDYDSQYAFQHDLLCAMWPVIDKHFTDNSSINDPYDSYSRILAELEYAWDTHQEQQYTESVLRPEFLASPPAGYSREQIEKMSCEDIIALKLALQDDGKDPLEVKYDIT